jgi:hypothetical protein
MESHSYPAVNYEKTILMKHCDKGTDIIMHELLVDDVMSVPTCDKLHDEFLKLYKKDFDITGLKHSWAWRLNNLTK